MRALALAAVWCVSILMALAGAAAAQVPAAAGRPDGDLALLERWLTGEFDNFQQYYEAKETKAAQPHERVHLAIGPIAVPGIEGRALLVRESARNEPDRIAGLHVYTLAAGPAESQVLLRVYAVTDPAVLAAMMADPKQPVSLTPSQLTPVPGNSVIWRRDGSAFAGATAPATGPAAASRTGKRVQATSTYRLTADEFWFSDRVTDEAGTLLSGRADGVPYKLMRARPFTCYAAMLKEGTTDKYDGMLNVPMHDQGKLVRFRTEDGRDTKYTFELSQLRYSQKVPVMKLALYEDGKEQAFTYSWAETTSAKIGINLRWIQVGCSLK
jgi:hypothetical protein